MMLPETHAMLISIREKWAVHTNTGRTLFVEREYDDDTQQWIYTAATNEMGGDALDRCIKIIERQPMAHGHWKEAGLDKKTHELIRENMLPPEPEYMPDKEVPCGE